MIWQSAVSFVVILGLLVLVHELGHFLVARLFKVGVDEFGFGFPPRLFGRKIGQTVYSINAIPLGGFVKIKGIIEGDEPNAQAPQTDHFTAQPLWKRFSILIAGIVMNYLLTIVLLAVGYSVGMPSYLDQLPASARVMDRAITVADITPEVPAAVAGLTTGDAITAVNGTAVTTLSEVKQQLVTVLPGESVLLTLQRDSQAMTITTVTITLADGAPGIGAYFVETGRVQLPVGQAILQASRQTWQLTKGLALAFVGLLRSAFQGEDVSGAVSGPVGIATLTYQATQLGFVYLIQFAALLSLNLAIFNLLPFPPLDGGKLIFVLLEAIVRRPVPLRWQIAVHNIGFIIFLIFIMAVTVKDVIGLVS